jgi:hypothetical protein
MKHYIGGSTALKYWFGDQWKRVPNDTDIICDQEYFDYYLLAYKEEIVAKVQTKRGFVLHRLGFKPLEFEIAKPGNSAEAFLKIKEQTLDGFLSPEEVYTFKMSHRFLKNSPHFLKTMNDIIELRKLGFGEIPSYLKDFYNLRIKETYDYSHPSLKKSKFDFFDTATGIVYEFIHDDIHEAIKHFSRPAYETIKEDKSEVFCSKERFFSVPETLRLLTVLEEAMVLSLERYLIPNKFFDKEKAKKGFDIALEKCCTSIASGYWREYAYNHYYDVQALYDPGYVNKFQYALSNGLIRLYDGK